MVRCNVATIRRKHFEGNKLEVGFLSALLTRTLAARFDKDTAGIRIRCSELLHVPF
jgi:hypothetical protein